MGLKSYQFAWVKADKAGHKEDSATETWRERKSNQEGRRSEDDPEGGEEVSFQEVSWGGDFLSILAWECAEISDRAQPQFLALTVESECVWAHRTHGLRHDQCGPQAKELFLSSEPDMNLEAVLVLRMGWEKDSQNKSWIFCQLSK